MKQQIDVYVKLTFEADAELSTEELQDKFSTEIITGCQVFSEELTAPVEILQIIEEAEGRDFIVTLKDKKKKKRKNNY